MSMVMPVCATLDTCKCGLDIDSIFCIATGLTSTVTLLTLLMCN